MKVGEQLLYLTQLKGMETSAAKKAINFWLDRFGATDWKKKEVSELSKGMSQKIQFIATIAHDPDIYIFDEPFSGLDPINSETLKEVIIDLRSQVKRFYFQRIVWNRWNKCATISAYSTKEKPYFKVIYAK